jgi:ferredoxin
MIRISVDVSRCIGAGQCVLAAPDVFDQDDAGLVVLRDETPGDSTAEAVRRAGTRCPSQSITVRETEP